ncbi:hypothetical protein S7711_07778 [Stachybotrys chartarum IBT 7711]|uniref:Protein SIP5 n=1 Tax=Stachybotrys chartarum (strain CBS 109288 / IBT 7711) TaxID=1280523 RepID=A0A084B8Q9_STACB|nr:hypothetical protein S7711_07778 [Stachybotrys chartarum IBT 7711]
MGNSSSRGADAPEGASEPRDRHPSSSDPAAALRESRANRNRMSRGTDLSFLGLGHGPTGRERDRSDAPYERRETRQEREARRLEKERVTRLKEREDSLREEHVDGGYLVTLGTYIGPEDFSKTVVRQLQIERKLAPFWRGLNDWSDNWAEHQLVAAARGLPIPPADAPPDPELIPQPPAPEPSTSPNIQNLMVPMGPRTMSAASDRSASVTGSSLPSPTSASAPGKSSTFKPRAKALSAALSIGSRNNSSTDLSPKEIKLPHDPWVNGQPLEVFLYKDAIECPICFLSYPPYLNHTRCCDQSICSECFVQIKRADPHLPEHHPDGETRDPNEGLQPQDPPEMLISEPSCCPYCQQPEFGVIYNPPPFRRGLVYSVPPGALSSNTAMSSQSSLNSTLPVSPLPTNRRRTHSLSANAPNVITTDRVRPDWATKLAAARASQARRAAAATALHAAAFLMGSTEQRSILRPGRFSRRNTENREQTAQQAAAETPEEPISPPGRNPDGSRRSRMEELEDMMFMEAVRLSLAAEEDRKRKEDKAIRKETKRREKEQRKALKKQGGDPYGGGTSGGSRSSLSLGLGRKRGNSAASNLRMDATVQSASRATRDDASPTTESHPEPAGKGKGVERFPSESSSGESSFSGTLPVPISGGGRTGSHLRQMSNASSLGSSLADSQPGSFSAQGFAGTEGTESRTGGTSSSRNEDGDGSEPMFNFRSLAEMVGVNIEDGTARREGDEEGESPGGAPLVRPLSQVQEDDKEDAEAQHVEEAPTATITTVAAPTPTVAPAISPPEGSPSPRIGELSTPELTVTPVTPAPNDETTTESKQLGHSKATEQPLQTA